MLKLNVVTRAKPDQWLLHVCPSARMKSGLSEVTHWMKAGIRAGVRAGKRMTTVINSGLTN